MNKKSRKHNIRVMGEFIGNAGTVMPENSFFMQDKPIMEFLNQKQNHQPMSKEYRYNLSFAEKVDRICICQSKESYSGTDKYQQEIKDILHDIQVDLDNGVKVTAEIIRAIVVLTQSNLAIWLGEDDIRKGQSTKTDKEKAEALTQTHLLNGTRSISKTRIQNLIGGRTDEKIQCIAENSAWNINW